MAQTYSNTDLLAQMNSAYVANDYINNAVSSEQSRVGRLDAMAKRDVYRLRGQSLGVVYTSERCRFLSMLTRVLLLGSIFVIGILSVTAQDLISRRTGVFLGVLVTLLTGVALLMLVSNAASRRNDAWGHYYWGSKTKQNVGSTDQCST